MKTGLRLSHCKACPSSLFRQQPQTLVVSPKGRTFICLEGVDTRLSQQPASCDSEWANSLVRALPQMVAPCTNCPCSRVRCPLPGSSHSTNPPFSYFFSLLIHPYEFHIFPFVCYHFSRFSSRAHGLSSNGYLVRFTVTNLNYLLLNGP